MSVENPQNTNSNEIGAKPCNGDSQPINGLSNGHVEMNGSTHDKSSSSSKHKSSSKDKYRDKDRDRDRDKDRDKNKSSSSKDYSKNSSSSSKDKYRDKERDKERDKDRDKDRDKNRDKDRDKDRDRDRDKNRDKDNKDKSSSDKHKSSSSSTHKSSTKDKDRERDKDRHRDKDKERSSHKDKDKEKSSRDNKDRSSKDEKPKESSDKDRSKDHKSSSTKDKERSSDKDKHRSSDKDKDRHKSSSSKDKHSSSSTSKSKDKDKDRDRDKNRSKDKDRDRERRDKERDREKRRDKEKTSKSSTTDENATTKLENGYVNNAAEQMMINNCNFNGINEIYIKDDNIPHNHYISENPPNIAKNEVINASQASSCDYSMSQFREDESAFSQKLYMDESQNNFDNASQDPIGSGNDENEFGNGVANDEEDIPLSKRKVEVKIEPKYDKNINEDVALSKRKHPNLQNDEEDVPLISRKKVKQEVKIEDDSEEDTPLLARRKVKKEESDEDVPLASRKIKTAIPKQKKRGAIDDEEEFDDKPKKKKAKPVATRVAVKVENQSPTKGGKKKKAEEEPDDVWRWWEEEKRDDSIKWNFLEHKGPMFPPDYERLPSNVRFYYDGKHLKLSDETEEVGSFYAKMLNHDYVTKKIFNDNFFKDWRKSMTQHEKDIIKDLGKCNFKEIHNYFTALSEKNKNRSKEEKKALKEQNEAIIKEYGFCTIDGHKEKIGNFRLEPPGLFRGRGEHPKMGMVKKRLRPEDIIINCSKNSNVPKPPSGHRWKEVKHDNTVTWLASWIENVQGQGKYIMLNPSSKIKGEKDFQKYETARRLDKHIDKIRNTYREEWKSKEMKIRQRAVALYFIDKLALRAGNEKDEDQADTVGCCSLRVEHVELHKELDGKENVVVFDFLGKDSIRYYNAVPVEKRVFKNLELFKENKKEGDELFDRLNTSILNEHLRDLMEGLTAKVFRTYNASITLQRQLDLLTEEGSTIPEKMLSYNRANRAVAILCNHQRSVPKSHEKSMENLKGKIQAKRDAIDDAEAEYKELKKDARRGSVKEKINADKKLKQLERLKEQLKKLELQETDRDENKTIALGTSKLNYLDPRISVAWCKKHDVPIEKIFNKTQRDKFRWAIHMADENYRF